ncbi:MAG: DNA-processing protein DprA [Prevotellaceae bacterium]|jgi:DNA processing protein|nr:DNA-processing protein DprA [Prevotellaceae bacterium]
MMPEGLQYYIAVELIPSIGSILAKRLIAYCGNVETIFTASHTALQKIPGIGSILAHEIVSHRAAALKRAERELLFIEEYKIKTYCYSSPEYSELLRQCEDAPVVFFAKGDIDFNRTKFLSIVGTRNATAYGRMVCEKIIGQLAERGHRLAIVSGLAYGIDICAHRAALQNNLDTVAVMATGLNTIYPSAHTATARQIVEHGALVSDFVSDTKIDPKNFLKRNRIIAGLSAGTLVVESHLKGGALITAEIATSYNREVMAVPGRIGDAASEGCNALVRKSNAAMVESAADVENVLNWEQTVASVPAKQLLLFDGLTAEEQQIVALLREHGAPEEIGTLSYRTNIPTGRLSSLLFELELKGAVKTLPGNQYMLKT